MDVAIIGIGIHPFGRFDDLSALDMGVTAARQALSDAGVDVGRRAVRGGRQPR